MKLKGGTISMDKKIFNRLVEYCGELEKIILEKDKKINRLTNVLDSFTENGIYRSNYGIWCTKNWGKR